MVDKALYRLSLVGVIDDLTVDYGADTVTATFASYDADTIDDGLVTFATRIQPGRHRAHVGAIRTAPAGFSERLEHHLRYLIDLVYAVIEPARLNALREMWRLTLGNPDDQRIRGTISAYLGQGPTATVLSSIAIAEDIEVGSSLQQLEQCQPGDPFEWAGAAARQLESYPGHPIMLAVRAAGEVQVPGGTPVAFGQFVTELLGNLDDYQLTDHDGDELFRWLREAVLNHNAGRCASWVAYVWALWLHNRGPSAGLDEQSWSVLNDPDANEFDLDAARAYRLHRLGQQLDMPNSESTGDHT